jgi:hypothetical protein
VVERVLKDLLPLLRQRIDVGVAVLRVDRCHGEDRQRGVVLLVDRDERVFVVSADDIDPKRRRIVRRRRVGSDLDRRDDLLQDALDDRRALRDRDLPGTRRRGRRDPEEHRTVQDDRGGDEQAFLADVERRGGRRGKRERHRLRRSASATRQPNEYCQQDEEEPYVGHVLLVRVPVRRASNPSARRVRHEQALGGASFVQVPTSRLRRNRRRPSRRRHRPRSRRRNRRRSPPGCR